MTRIRIEELMIEIGCDRSLLDDLRAAGLFEAEDLPLEEADDPVLVDFKRALDEVLIELAQLLARDGEGATRKTVRWAAAPGRAAARGAEPRARGDREPARAARRRRARRVPSPPCQSRPRQGGRRSSRHRLPA